MAWRLLPYLFLLYVISYIDRVNVGFAALQMNADLGLSATAYGFGAGIFFIGYALCEVPSNLILARVGARRWIARIMVTWGIISIAMVFARGPVSFCVLRFLLGAAEAGFFPGVIYYLSNWFPREERARAVSWFMLCIPASVIVGGPLAGYLLGLHGWHGLAGWHWLFIIEGLPAVLLGVVSWFFLTESPREARWLTPAEREFLDARIRVEQERAVASHGVTLRGALLHPTVWLLAFIMFAGQTGTYGITYWLPQIVRSLSGLTDLEVGMVSALPYAAAASGMVLLARSSDRSGERFLHVAVPYAIAALGFIASVFTVTPTAALLALTVAAVGDLSSRGPFWALPGRFLAGSASAAGIALINTVAAVGGFVGPYAVGLAKDMTGEFSAGLVLMAPLLIAGAIATLVLRSSPVFRAEARSPR